MTDLRRRSFHSAVAGDYPATIVYRIRHKGSERGDVDYYYDGTAIIEERTNNALLAHYRYAGKALSLMTPGDTQYYHLDALGSTTDLTDGTGATKTSYTLDPWGHIRNQIGESVNRQIFTGQEHDQKTSLIYFGARYYDPDTARFISQDSYLGETSTPPSLNRYLYAYSNPTVYVDLEGYIGVFFDGTGMDKDKGDIPRTNITKLYESYADGPARYYEGVGSDWYTKYTLGGFSGAGGKNRADKAYGDLVKEYNAAKAEDRNIDIFGFSRGASLARELANKIKREGIPDTSNQNGKKFEDVSIRFMGLFDTVGSFGLPGNGIDIGYDLSVDKNFVKQTRHAIAKDEYRGLFGLQSILEGEDALAPPNMVEKVFRGAHSDVGGGYADGEDGKSNELARIPLNWMYEEAKKAGVTFESLKDIDRQMPDISKMSESELKEKYIHDSRYFWEQWSNKKLRDIYYPNSKLTNTVTKITTEDRKSLHDGVILNLDSR